MFWISDSAPVASRAHSSVCACVVPLFCCSFILVTKLPVEQTKRIVRSLGVPSTFWWPLAAWESFRTLARALVLVELAL